MTIASSLPGKAYIDESHQDAHGPEVWSVCAYVTGWQGALDLEREWRGALRHSNVPAFHNKVFLHGKGPLAGWSRE